MFLLVCDWRYPLLTASPHTCIYYTHTRLQVKGPYTPCCSHPINNQTTYLFRDMNYNAGIAGLAYVYEEFLFFDFLRINSWLHPQQTITYQGLSLREPELIVYYPPTVQVFATSTVDEALVMVMYHDTQLCILIKCINYLFIHSRNHTYPVDERPGMEQ